MLIGFWSLVVTNWRLRTQRHVIFHFPTDFGFPIALLVHTTRDTFAVPDQKNHWTNTPIKIDSEPIAKCAPPHLLRAVVGPRSSNCVALFTCIQYVNVGSGTELLL